MKEPMFKNQQFSRKLVKQPNGRTHQLDVPVGTKMSWLRQGCPVESMVISKRADSDGDYMYTLSGWGNNMTFWLIPEQWDNIQLPSKKIDKQYEKLFV